MLCILYFTCILLVLYLYCILYLCVFCNSLRMSHWNKRLLSYLLFTPSAAVISQVIRYSPLSTRQRLMAGTHYPCLRPVFTNGRHFWTPVYTARAYTCDTLVTNTARGHRFMSVNHFPYLPIVTNPKKTIRVSRRWSGSPPKFNRLFAGPLPIFPENFMQIRSEVFAQSW